MTIDVFCPSGPDYERIAQSPVTDPQVIAQLYGIGTTDVAIFALPHLNVIKISFPRPQVQGSLDDRDAHGGQQYVPLLDVVVPPTAASA
jgi:hypothetical protein